MTSEHGILIYPHQLFSPLPAWMDRGQIFLIEDAHFFSSLRFHKQKLVLHRASMQSYARRLRQIIGWREFMWGVYRAVGMKQRRQNFWGIDNDLPQAFYEGTTGILPVDTVIQRVLDHAYCHHIERLMVLGNIMLLCEIHPDQVYEWFMELFIDAYDWVMVPNVYGMSQYADGGWMTTKPYIKMETCHVYVEKNHPGSRVAGNGV